MNKLLNKTLLIRSISGVGLFVIVVGATLLSQQTFALLVGVIAVGSLWEFYRIAQKKGVQPQKGLGVTMAVAVLGAGYAVAVEEVEIQSVAWLMVLPTVVFIVELYRKKNSPLSNISATIAGVLYTAGAMALLFFVAIEQGGEYLRWVVLSYIFIIWANDVGAYLVGSLIGQHKLFERISPNKSWEGFCGGVIFAVAMAVLSAVLMEQRILVWVGLAVVVVVSGVLGDLVESMLKREAGIKDSGAIIPGHGGFLDRFDAMLISAPFVFLYLKYVLSF